MTHKELIGILQALPPDGTPCFSLGRWGEEKDEYKELCAKAELISGVCLDALVIDRIEIIDSSDGSIWADIHLSQDNLSISDLKSFGKKFDEQYKKI